MAALPIARTQVVPLIVQSGSAKVTLGVWLPPKEPRPSLVKVASATPIRTVAAATLPLESIALNATVGTPVNPVPPLFRVRPVTSPSAGTQGPCEEVFTTLLIAGVPSGYSESGRL